MVRKISFFLDFDQHINLALTIPTFNLLPHKSSHDIVRVGQAHEELDAAHMSLPAIWYLSYERHQTKANRQSFSTNTNSICYADNISDFELSSDEEENDYFYTLNRRIRIYK